jgi:FMN reductase (NADPH)
VTNPTLDVMVAHASMRHYNPDPPSKEIIETIVSAAQHASTSSNLQAYSVVAVADKAKREKLSVLCGDQVFIREAPIFLAWCADLARLNRVCKMRGYSQVTEYVENFLVAAVDTALAAQNAAIAAESLGLGICFVGQIRKIPEEIIALLGLPSLTFPIVGMTLGWPAREPRIRPRLPIEAILHWEKYNQDQDKVLNEYDQAMLKTGIYQNRQISISDEPGKMENYGWMEHTARRISKPERTTLRKSLEKQGFALK